MCWPERSPWISCTGNRENQESPSQFLKGVMNRSEALRLSSPESSSQTHIAVGRSQMGASDFSRLKTNVRDPLELRDI